MKKILTMVGAFIGGTVGWAAGDRMGMMTAFVLSMIGTGIGVYAGIKLAQRYEV